MKPIWISVHRILRIKQNPGKNTSCNETLKNSVSKHAISVVDDIYSKTNIYQQITSFSFGTPPSCTKYFTDIVIRARTKTLMTKIHHKNVPHLCSNMFGFIGFSVVMSSIRQMSIFRCCVKQGFVISVSSSKRHKTVEKNRARKKKKRIQLSWHM